MKLKTRFFRFLIFSNILVALTTTSIFLSYSILNTISYEKENLLLINRRFSCLLNHTLTAFTKTLDTIKYSNDIFLLLTDEERLKKFVSLKINRELENIIKNFPIVKSIFILKDGEIIFPQENLKLNLEKTVFLKDNEVFFVHQIPIDEHMTLASLINISQALREFLENEKLKTNIDLIIFKENYISVSADSARIIGKEALRSLVLSQKIDFGIFDMYIARPKKLIYSSLYKPILTTVVFLIPLIWVLYVLSKYLSNRISTSLVKITQKLASFKDKKFDIIEVG